MILKLRKFSAAKNFGALTLKGLLSAALMLVVSGVWGQVTLAGWEMNGLSAYGSSPFAPTTSDINLTINGLTRSAGVGTGGTAAGNAWGGTTWDGENVTFSITTNSGFQMSVSTLEAYNVRRSGTGATTGQWQYNTGSGFVNIGTAITWGSTTSSGGNLQSSIDLSGITALQNFSGTVTFRLNLSGGTTGTWYLNNFQTGNDFVVTGTLSSSPNPTISISSPTQTTSTTVNQGATNHLLSQFQAAVTDDDAQLTAVSFESNGTYAAASDISNYRLWYNSVNNFAGAANLSTVAAGVTSGSTVTFSGLNQTIAENATGYFWITVDVAAGATASNTVIATGHSMTFSSGNQSGSISDGGAQTIQSVNPALALSSPNPAVAAANFDQNTTNNLIYRFDMAMTVANTDLTEISITTNGTYAANAVSNLKAWYSTDDAFDAGSDVLLATIASPAVAGAQSFTGFTQTLLSGNTSYIFITVDVSCDALDGATIGVDAITTADIVTTASESGSANASGTHTLDEVTPNNSTALSTSIASESITISWTNPTACFDEVMIVAKAGSTIAGTPSGDGSAYTADLDFAGAGTTFDGGKVVYKGSTSDQTITGLTNGTQYFLRIFTRNGESWSAGVEVDETPENLVTVDFDDIGKWTQGSAAITSYADHSYTDGNVTVQGDSVLRNSISVTDGFAGALGTYSFRLRNDRNAGSKLVTTISSGGVNTFSFDIRRWDGDPDPDYTLRYSTNGGDSYTTVATINNAALDGISDWKTFSGTINSPFNNILIEIVRNGGERIMVDNFVYSPRAFEATTWNGSAWSNGTPDATKNATISGNLTVAAGFTANNLTIDNSVTVTLDPSQDLTVNGSFENNGSLDIADNTLTLAGTYSGSGNIRANGGSMVLNGSGALGTLNFDQTTDGTTNTLAALTINRSSTGSATLGNKLNLTSTLTLTDGVLNTGGNLHLKSTSASATAQVVGGTNASIDGNVVVERFLPWLSAANDGFRFVGHPLRANPVVNTVTGLPTGNNTLIGYDEAAGGSGAYVGINDRTTSWGQAVALGVWTNSTNTLVFTGELQLSDVGPVNLSNTGSGWLYIANPFPSVVDYNEVVRNNVNNAKYRWVKDNSGQGSGNWGAFVGGLASNGGSRKIAPGQGFMVKTTGNGTASVTFPAAARVANDTTTFTRTGSFGDIYRVAVKNTANNTGMETVLRFTAAATTNFDGDYDALFLTDYVNASPDLYTMDANGEKYSINALPEMGLDPVMFPLQLETFGPGSYSFSFDASQFLSGVSVQLEDTKLGTFGPVFDGQTIAFTAGPNDATDRFRLHFNGLATSVATNQLDQVQLYSHEGALYVRGIEQAEQLRILDISGRVVFELNAPQFDGNAIQPMLNKGTYLVQLMSQTGVKTVKVIF